MQSIILTVPGMYGDHHVLAVRAILLALPGIDDVYASSAFKQVRVTFDSALIAEDKIRAALKEAGYEADGVKPIVIPVTYGETARHTAAYEGVGRTVAFIQEAPARLATGPHPCPGFDVQRMED